MLSMAELPRAYWAKAWSKWVLPLPGGPASTSVVVVVVDKFFALEIKFWHGALVYFFYPLEVLLPANAGVLSTLLQGRRAFSSTDSGKYRHSGSSSVAWNPIAW